MIYIERTITIEDNSAEIEEPVVLYKGDSNIEVQFTITNNPFKYKAGIDLTYGQLIIKRPKTDPIFSEVAKLSSSKVLFIITGDMIDEFEELGDYDFQIRLLNEDMSSRATLPPVSAGIMIKEPLCEEGINTAPVNYSRTRISREIENTFDEEGNYNKTDWSNGDIITDKKLNKIEDALYEINDNSAAKEDIPVAVSQLDNDADYATKEELPIVPTDISAFANDAGYLTEHQDISHLATKDELPTNVSELNNDAKYASEGYVNSVTGNARNEAMNYALGLSNNKADKDHNHDEYITEQYVKDAIANIEVSGDVNLKDYVTKENPEMNGTFSLNRKPDSPIGDYSVAMGENTSAEGWASHAEGIRTSAYGRASHVEGEDTKAYWDYSHAEGKETVADGEASHTEGIGTVAKGKCQHVQGRYNIEDEEDWEYEWEDSSYKYAHIVGNGRNSGERSNAYTLDWKGNAWFAGRAYVGEENGEERKQLATEDFVREEIRNIEVSGGVDLEKYVTKEDHYMDIAYKSDIDHNHDDMYLDKKSLDGYATESYVNEAIGNIDALLDAINGEVL